MVTAVYPQQSAGCQMVDQESGKPYDTLLRVSRCIVEQQQAFFEQVKNI